MNIPVQVKDQEGNLVRCGVCSRGLVYKDNQPYCFYCEKIKHEDHKLAEETLKAHQDMRFHKQLEHFQINSLINEKLKNANFDTYEPLNESQSKALYVCKRYADNFNPDKAASLILHGPYGTGKSHLAKSITDIVMAKDISALFISVPKLMTKIKSTFKNTGLSEYEILEALAEVQLLVLDDLGAERTSDEEKALAWSKTKLFEIFDSRAGKHTVITTNFEIGQAMKVYGERDLSRFLEDAYPVKIDGENFRMRKF